MTWVNPLSLVALGAGQTGSTAPYVEAWLSNTYNLGINGVFNRINFNQVSADTANAYAPASGTFTAPVAGVYHIASGMMINSVNSAVVMAVFKNGVVNKSIMAYSYPQWAVAAISVSLYLNAGDTVDIRAYNNTSAVVSAITSPEKTWLTIALMRA